MAITPLNQNDVYRIVHDFDQDYFQTVKPLRDDQIDRIRVIIQFERMLASHRLPMELIDDIMRRCLQNSPSVEAFLLYYKNTPAITLLHPLPLSTNTHYINTASKSLLVRFKQKPSDGKLASYQQLMARVFNHHFKKLTIDQKLELIRRSNITPWEQRSTSQKLELLGRIQATTFWGQTKLNLQLLSWKVQFVIASALEKRIISGFLVIPVLVSTLVLFFSAALAFTTLFASVFLPSAFTNAFATIFATCAVVFIRVIIIGIKSLVAFGVLSVLTSLIGIALQFPLFPKCIKDKGYWLLQLGWNCFLIAICFPGQYLLYNSLAWKASFQLGQSLKELDRLFLESINKANITTEKNAFINAHLPDLLNEWIQLVDPNDTNTGSLQIDTQELKQLV